ncbi:GMC oxidoreductase [Sphingomonas sp. RB1R13]
MSRDPPDGVVDPFGEAYELPNLFISDGSQFVTSTARNITLTIVALALR